MSDFEQFQRLSEQLTILTLRIDELSKFQQELRDLLLNQSVRKEWYSTSELAEIMGVKQ